MHIDCIRSAFFFEGVLRDALHRFKYRGLTALVAPLGELMVAYWTDHPMLADVVVPVPLHMARLRDRGYNQAALLARVLVDRTMLSVDEHSLVRHRPTPPQVGLDVEQRKENVLGAFRCQGDALARRRVLLIDDVCTTGATLDACAVALKEGGAQTVRALTVARARHPVLSDQS